MSGTTRNPIRRPPTQQITRRAALLWRDMCKLRCRCPQSKPVTSDPCANCERWHDLHSELHVELQLRPWVWPCVVPRDENGAGSRAEPGENTIALMDALDEAIRKRALVTP